MKKLLLTTFLISTSFLTPVSFGQDSKDHLLKVIMWFRLEDYHKVIEECNQALSLDSKNYLIYHFRGRAKAILEDYRGAILDFDKTLQLNPKFGEGYLDRGMCKVKLGQKNDGCLDLSKAGELGEKMAYEVIREVCN